jgi:hypothetical protein
VTKEKLIGNLLANQARVEESHEGRKQCFLGGGVANFCLLSTKKFEKIRSFGGFFFFRVTSPKISKLN